MTPDIPMLIAPPPRSKVSLISRPSFPPQPSPVNGEVPACKIESFFLWVYFRPLSSYFFLFSRYFSLSFLPPPWSSWIVSVPLYLQELPLLGPGRPQERSTPSPSMTLVMGVFRFFPSLNRTFLQWDFAQVFPLLPPLSPQLPPPCGANSDDLNLPQYRVLLRNRLPASFPFEFPPLLPIQILFFPGLSFSTPEIVPYVFCESVLLALPRDGRFRITPFSLLFLGQCLT